MCNMLTSFSWFQMFPGLVDGAITSECMQEIGCLHLEGVEGITTAFLQEQTAEL